ncbi:MAG: DUF1289 domain-containing protein [Gammaproteobacteria bacterium]|nr:DUF1289 domain-containing protein [Gammaproteobacteria bacterium]
MTRTPAPSPCVRNCCLDDGDICLGCHRSLAEIVAWGSASEAERHAILERARERGRQRSTERQSRSITGNTKAHERKN